MPRITGLQAFGNDTAPVVESARGPRVVPQAYDKSGGIAEIGGAVQSASDVVFRQQQAEKALFAQQKAELDRLARIAQTTRAKRDQLMADQQMGVWQKEILANPALKSPDEQLAAFDEKVNSQRADLENTYGDPEVRGAFQQGMDTLQFKHRGELLGKITAATQSQIEADVNQNLDVYRVTGVSDPEAAITKSAKDIAAAGSAAGWDAARIQRVTATQTSGIMTAYASRRMLTDPRGLQAELLDETKWPGMRPEDRTRLLSQADKMIEQDDREKTRMADAFDRDQARAVKDAQEQRAADARLGVLSGEVGERDLEGMLQRREITLEHFNSLHTAVGAEGGGSDDPYTVVNLQRDIPSGIANEDNVMSSWQDGRLSKQTAVALLGNVDQARRNGGPLASEEAKAGRRYIDDNVGGIRGPLAVLDTEASQRVAAAIREFDDRVLAGEKPRAVSDDVTQRYMPTPARPAQSPRFLVGTYSQPDITATRAATADAYARGAISAETAKTESLLLQQYQAWMDKQEAARAAAAAASKSRGR